jgi:hypothetical protein
MNFIVETVDVDTGKRGHVIAVTTNVGEHGAAICSDPDFKFPLLFAAGDVAETVARLKWWVAPPSSGGRPRQDGEAGGPRSDAAEPHDGRTHRHHQQRRHRRQGQRRPGRVSQRLRARREEQSLFYNKLSTNSKLLG